MSAPLLVVGSVALDTLDLERRTVTGELGGSAVYFALAASLIGPVSLVAPVGRDAAERVRAVFSGRDVDLDGLDVLDRPTYRWHARLAAGRNVDLGSSDSIYDVWRPRLPAVFDGWAFVGSMRAALQLAAAERLGSARLLAADAMLSYTVAAPREAMALVERCHWFFCNTDELAALGAPPASPARFRAEHGLDGLCVKAGAAGAHVFTAAGETRVPAPPQSPPDTTGAGDALAGGFLARWNSLDADPGGIQDALVHGVACASLAIEDVGTNGIARATPAGLARRVEEVRRWLGNGGSETQS